jgi:hypothetical protein
LRGRRRRNPFGHSLTAESPELLSRPVRGSEPVLAEGMPRRDAQARQGTMSGCKVSEALSRPKSSAVISKFSLASDALALVL